MPIFEYRCGSCGKTFEELVYGDRDRQVPCPACGSDKSIKIPSVIGGIVSGASASAPCSTSCAGSSVCPASGGPCCSHAH